MVAITHLETPPSSLLSHLSQLHIKACTHNSFHGRISRVYTHSPLVTLKVVRFVADDVHYTLVSPLQTNGTLDSSCIVVQLGAVSV